jgi:methanogenic corrinoid protein MtbC1
MSGSSEDARREFTGRLLRAGQSSIVARIAERVQQNGLDLEAEYGANAEATCLAEASRHVEALYDAFLDDDLAAYTTHVARAHALDGARGHRGSHPMLEATVQVLEEDLPTASWGLLKEFLRRTRVQLAHERSGSSAGGLQAQLQADFLQACFLGDRQSASDGLVEAVRAGRLTQREAMLEVLMPMLREVGLRWAHNEVTSAEEHAVSTTVELTLGRLYEYAPRGPDQGHTVVVGMAQGEHHQIGARILADLLDSGGYRVSYLGADNEPHAFARMAMDVDASAVVVAAVRSQGLTAVREAVHHVHRIAGRRVPVVVGGGPFTIDPEAGIWCGADAVAQDVGHALDLVGGFARARRSVID